MKMRKDPDRRKDLPKSLSSRTGTGTQASPFPVRDKKLWFLDFPSGPVVKSLPPNAGSVGSILGQGTKVPHAVEYGLTLKKKKRLLPVYNLSFSLQGWQPPSKGQGRLTHL